MDIHKSSDPLMRWSHDDNAHGHLGVWSWWSVRLCIVLSTLIHPCYSVAGYAYNVWEIIIHTRFICPLKAWKSTVELEQLTYIYSKIFNTVNLTKDNNDCIQNKSCHHISTCNGTICIFVHCRIQWRTYSTFLCNVYSM